MAKGVPIQGRNPSGKAQIANVTAEGDLKVQLSGTMATSGLLVDRPAASAVPRGFAYYAWDGPEGQKMTYSNGTSWVVSS